MSTKSTRSVKILIWLLFSVCFSLLPIAINYINIRFQGAHQPTTELIMGGELFLISGAIAADALGRTVRGGDRLQAFRIFCGGGCLLLLVVTSIYFGDIAFAQQRNRDNMEEALRSQDLAVITKQYKNGPANVNVASDSIWLFGFTVIAALGVILVERD